MSAFHPELASARFMPSIPMSAGSVKLLNRVSMKPKPAPADVRIDQVMVPGPGGDVRLRIYTPVALTEPGPALFWIHGGGYVIGSPEQDEARCIEIARTLGIVVASTAYRLAPANPSPASLEDVHATISWLVENAAERGVDANRIAVGGASAGAGLAAGLVLYLHDRGEVHPIFQLLVYPMLDDRTVLRTDQDTRNVRGWSVKANRFGWTSHLGVEPGSDGVSPYAAPARREDLTGLPPAWIGVGTLDLFHDEDVEYARRLNESGVPCELFIVDGAFHGFDAMFGKTAVVREFWDEQDRALHAALRP